MKQPIHLSKSTTPSHIGKLKWALKLPSTIIDTSGSWQEHILREDWNYVTKLSNMPQRKAKWNMRIFIKTHLSYLMAIKILLASVSTKASDQLEIPYVVGQKFVPWSARRKTQREWI